MAAAASSSVLSHWHRLIDGFQTSPTEFYAALERAIGSRQVPDASRSRVDWQEAGVLSARREYLRIVRREHTFDVCGAPFGNGFFVSWWLTTPLPPLIIRLALLMLCLVIWVVLTNILFVVVAGFFRLIGWELLGLMLGSIGAFVGGIAGLFILLHLGVQRGALQESVVEAIPGVGFVYHRFLSPLTYYRLDTALMFQDAIHHSVLEALESMTTGKGIRALTEAEQKPIMRGLLA